MKPITIALPGLLLFILLFGKTVTAQEKTIAWYVEHAPFAFPLPIAPSIPERSFNILDYGAVGDGQTRLCKRCQ